MTKIHTDDYCVQPEQKVKLANIKADDTSPFKPGKKGKETAREHFAEQKEKLAELQELLYADGSQSLLVVFQAMDAGGKDGCIEKVVGSFDPQGVKVTSFKVPTEEELAHDFLWRIHKEVPRKGMIGVFNRSHYEDVLIVRVKNLVPKKVWSKRYGFINAFEQGLVEAGTKIVKIYLHIDKDEQKKRLEERLADPTKQWKFNPGDLPERANWDSYMEAFEEVFERCSTEDAPWYIVPANSKWYRDVVVAQILIETLESMNLKYPKLEYNPAAVSIS
jgi:PPK2 family polyphosphate:nucleotide phosphotransferase